MRFCHLHLQMSNFPTKTSFIINIAFILFILFSSWGDYYRSTRVFHFRKIFNFAAQVGIGVYWVINKILIFYWIFKIKFRPPTPLFYANQGNFLYLLGALGTMGCKFLNASDTYCKTLSYLELCQKLAQSDKIQTPHGFVFCYENTKTDNIAMYQPITIPAFSRKNNLIKCSNIIAENDIIVNLSSLLFSM